MSIILSEKELLLKLAEADKIAFGHLFNVYYSRLFHFANHYLNDNESSKDVVQDVFSAVWEENQKFSEVKNLSSWLFTLTKNHCLKKIDSLKVRQKHADIIKNRELSLIQASLSELDTSSVIFDEISNIINQTLDNLSPLARQIFEMSRFENKKNKEIAEELNISVKTVEANITRILKQLKIALKNYLPIVLFLFR